MRQLTTRRARITLSVGVIVLTSALIIWGWWALIASGAEGYTFATGQGQAAKLELTVSSSATYNGSPQGTMAWSLKNLVPTADRFFAYSDLLPGDEGVHQIGVRVERSDAYVCLDFTNLEDIENGHLPAEIAAGDTSSEQGELSLLTQVFAWRDVNGNGQFDIGELPLFAPTPVTAFMAWNERTYPLADVTTGGAYPKNSAHFVGIAWCLGDMVVDAGMGVLTCEGQTIGNQAQTDRMTFDVSLRAIAAVGKPGFSCTVDSDAGGIPGQCPAGYEKIIDGYRGGLAWTADMDYAGVVLAGGPPGNNNKDPDGRFKFFAPVSTGQVVAREAHDISYICATQTLPEVTSVVETEPDWQQVTLTPVRSLPEVARVVRNRLGI